MCGILKRRVVASCWGVCDLHRAKGSKVALQAVEWGRRKMVASCQRWRIVQSLPGCCLAHFQAADKSVSSDAALTESAVIGGVSIMRSKTSLNRSDWAAEVEPARVDAAIDTAGR